MKARIKKVVERVKILKNWYLFVWPLARLRINKKANLRNGTKFFLRGGYPSDFTTLTEIAGRDHLELEAFAGLGTIVDIGAHVGIFAVLVAKQNPQSQIIAIEPEKDNYEMLEKNIALNDIKNIRPMHALISDKIGVQKLFLSKFNVGHSMVTNLHSLKNEGEFQEVNGITIESLGQIDGLKMDVEGAEYLIFKDYIPDCKIILLDTHQVAGESIDLLLNKFNSKYNIIELNSGKVTGAKTVKMIRKNE